MSCLMLRLGVASRPTRPSLARGSRRKKRRCARIRAAIDTASTSWTAQRLKHVVEAQQFCQSSLKTIFETAMEMEHVKRGTLESKQLEGYLMATLFYEPSTRTRLSFESAMTRLGGTVLTTESAGEYSSAAKGETLEGVISHFPTRSLM